MIPNVHDIINIEFGYIFLMVFVIIAFIIIDIYAIRTIILKDKQINRQAERVHKGLLRMIDAQMMEEVNKDIKNQITELKHKIRTDAAETYRLAWKQSIDERDSLVDELDRRRIVIESLMKEKRQIEAVALKHEDIIELKTETIIKQKEQIKELKKRVEDNNLGLRYLIKEIAKNIKREV